VFVPQERHWKRDTAERCHQVILDARFYAMYSANKITPLEKGIYK